MVVAHVDDQAFTIEDRVVIARPLVDVVGAHGLQMNVADLLVGGFIDFHAARVFPFGVAHAGVVAAADGLD